MRGKRPLVYILPALAYFLMLAVFIKNSYALLDFPLDDAWIHGVYAKSFALGHGFAYNSGGGQEAGSTSPLWSIFTAPAHWLGFLGSAPVVLFVKLITIILGVTTVWAVGSVARRISGSDLVAGLAATLFALEPRFLFSSLSGMENNLLIALWATGTASLFAGRPLLSVILFSLAPVTRPEAVLALPLAIPGLIFLSRKRGWLRLSTVFLWGTPVLPVLLWAAFCLLATGHPLPNTYYVKACPFHLSADQLRSAGHTLWGNGLISPGIWLIGTVAYGVACFKKINWQKMLSLLVFLAIPAIYAVAVVGTRLIRGESYYWTRWLDPPGLLLQIPFCIGFGVLLSAAIGILIPTDQARERVPLIKVLTFIAVVTCVAAAGSHYSHIFMKQRDLLASDSRAMRLINVRAGLWIEKHTPRDAIIGVNDAGAIRYFGQRQTIDLLGLNNSAVTFRTGRAEKPNWLAICPAWFQETPIMHVIDTQFEPRKQIRLPAAEYTLCKTPGQELLVIYERNPVGPTDN